MAVIEARVIQKVATEAEWLANPLMLYQGECAFVSDKYNFKLNTQPTPKKFIDLEYYYQGDVLGSVGIGEEDSKPTGVYRAKTSGIIGGVVVKDGYYTLLRKKEDGSWVLESEVKIPMQDLTAINNKLSTAQRDILDLDNKVDSVDSKVSSISDLFDKSIISLPKNTPTPTTTFNNVDGFYGYGYPIGNPDVFNEIELNIKTRSVVPLNITLVFRKNDINGSVISQSSHEVSLNPNSNNYVKLKFNTIRNIDNENIYIQYYSNVNFVSIISSSTLQFTNPPYGKSSWRNVNGNWNEDVTHRNLWYKLTYTYTGNTLGDSFFDNFLNESDKFSELNEEVAKIEGIEEKINDLNGDSIKFLPNEYELNGGAMNNPYGIGLLLSNKNVSFNKIELTVSGVGNYEKLVLNIYEYTDIPMGNNILFENSIHSQTFISGNIEMTDKTVIKLNKTIDSKGKHLMLVFTNFRTPNVRVQMLRKTNAPTPTGDFTYSYISVNGVDTLTSFFVKNADSIRFNSPILSLEKSTDINDVVINKEFKNNKINMKTESGSKNYIATEFRINEDINRSVLEKEILSFKNNNGDYLKLLIQCGNVTQTSKVQYSLNGNTVPVDRPQWGVESKYPLPYSNSQFRIKTKLGSLETTYQFPKRNFRDFKPLWGKDAFSVQFKPSVIRDGGLIANNQQIYIDNQDYFIEIIDDRVILYNDIISKRKEYLFTTYPYVDLLFKAISNDCKEGGYFENIVFESLNTGVISYNQQENLNKNARPSTDLLKCKLKLIDKYPYTGYLSNSNRMAYDSWRAFIPYAVDDSWHTFEIVSIEGTNDLLLMIDGKPYSSPVASGLIKNGGAIIKDCVLNLDNSYIDVDFKEFEFYKNHYNNYSYWFKSTEQNLAYIASKKNPRILGVMWHDVMYSDVIGRPTCWMDTPKHLRNSFDNQITLTHAGASIILYRKYNDFLEEPISLGGNRYSVKSRTGEVLAGVATIVNNSVSEIKVDTLVSGVWSTAPVGLELWQGKIIRVGDDVLLSTAFLEQCFQASENKGYKIITWQESIDVLRGLRSDSYKYLVPQFDDWALYMFTDNKIRSLFSKYKTKISVALELNHLYNSDGTVKSEEALNIAKTMQINGHENVLHQHFNPSKRPLEFLSGILSDEAERALIEAMYKSSVSGVSMTIHDQSANQSTDNSMKLMEYLGFEMSISTQNKSTTRATPLMYASRTGIYPRYANFGGAIE